jgi:hypothetical protein
MKLEAGLDNILHGQYPAEAFNGPDRIPDEQLFVNFKGIAEILGVTYSHAHKLKERHPSAFPKAGLKTTARNALYSVSSVITFAKFLTAENSGAGR